MVEADYPEDMNRQGRRAPKTIGRPREKYHVLRRQHQDTRETEVSKRLTASQPVTITKPQTTTGTSPASSSNSNISSAQTTGNNSTSSFNDVDRGTQNRFGEKPVSNKPSTSKNTQAREKQKPDTPPSISHTNSYPYSTISNLEILRSAANLLTGKVAFRPNFGRFFNEKYWSLGTYTQHDEDFLYVKTGIKPSEAVEAIFINPSSFSFDCGEFSQAILLYTLLHSIGAEKFNKLREADGYSFRLRRQGSTGLNRSAIKLAWDTENGVFTRYPESTPEKRSPENILEIVPVGSLVNFRNHDPNVASTNEHQNAYETENTIKVGPDKFIAFGFSTNNAFYTRKQIETNLARVVPGRKLSIEDYIKKYIWIQGIIPFTLPE